MTTRRPGAVSLAAELAVLARAVEGVIHVLGADEPADVPEDRQRAAVAMLNLLAARLVLLRRVVVGAAEAKASLATFNEADAPVPGDDPDLTVPVRLDGGFCRLRGARR